MRSFAKVLPLLQDLRHSADYDPAASFDTEGVQAAIAAAENAIAAFGRAPADERDDVLALMLVSAARL